MFQATISGLQEALKKYKGFEDQVYRAGVRAINRTLVSARAQAARQIKAESPALKIGYIKRFLLMTRASGQNMVGYIRPDNKEIQISRFNPKQTKSGLSLMVAGQQTLIPRGFFPGRGKVRVAYQRISSGSFHHGARLLRDEQARHVERIPGIPMARLFLSVLSTVSEKAQTDLDRRFARELKSALKGY